MAYRSLGTGWKKAILLNSHFLTDNSCTSVEIARRQTGTVRPISQIEHRTAKNEADERESKCLARHVRRPESVQQTGLCQLSLSGAHWCCSCLRANKAPCSDMQNVFHTSFHIKEIKQEDIQWSLNHLICKRPLSIKNGTLIKTFLSKVYHITCEFFYNRLLFQIVFSWGCAEIQAPGHHVWIQSDHRDAMCCRIFVVNTKDGWHLSRRNSGTPVYFAYLCFNCVTTRTVY